MTLIIGHLLICFALSSGVLMFLCLASFRSCPIHDKGLLQYIYKKYIMCNNNNNNNNKNNDNNKTNNKTNSQMALTQTSQP